MYGSEWTRGWHTFGVEWAHGRLTWYVDSRARKSIREAPNLPKYLIANLAVSDGASRPGRTAATPFPRTLKVDYIRVLHLPSRGN